jgi:hypothetical protein
MLAQAAGILRLGQLDLALAVIAEAGGLQDRGEAKFVDGARGRLRSLRRPGRGLQAEVVQESAFR